MAKLISSSSVFTTEFWEVVEVTNSKVAACVKASKEAYCISSGAVMENYTVAEVSPSSDEESA
ncbi:hypothetical protein NC653_018828 [Populus alba x Populus x berolinensis]|uniref:Uncharacterized protein n=1 Tax=Populus alba x Populus x berolinensis TaxID=444605 RepID=A0AAD6QHC6_9ROSI|nr:hypothetical protein NC653_018828 [Populus alba x Populus x berolinensis]